MKRTPLKRGRPPRRKGRARFPRMVDERLRNFCRQSRCIIDNGCRYAPKPWGCSDPAHVIPTARGVPDRDNLVPLCRGHHMEQEGRTREFERAHHVNLKAKARETTRACYGEEFV